MNATVMAIILVLIVVATVVTKKVPFNFVLFIVPIICSLLLGFSLQETSDFVLEQFSSIMKSAGFMLLFAFLYFQMLTEAGVFDTIVSAVTNKLGDKMNVIVIMILTSVIAAFAILTGNFTPAYLITFPILVPLYKKYDFDREAAFIIVFNNTGMVGAISDGLIKICPKFMLEYIHIILLLLCVIIIYFIPFQIFNAMYPVFISIGAGFGIPAVTIIAPFVCNLSLATSSTPTNSSTYLGCALTETDVQHFCKKAVPVQTVTNAIVILLALIFGIV